MSSEDLEQKLNKYKENFSKIELVLKLDPTNEAMLKAKSELLDVIQLTEDLLKLKRKPELTSAASSALGQTRADNNNNEGIGKPPLEDKITSKNNYNITPKDDTNGGQPHPPAENAVASLEGGEDGEEEVYAEEEEDDEDERGPAKDTKPFTIPKSLKILPGDSEEVRISKRKKIRAMKSQHRKKQMEQVRDTKKTAWQEFTSKSTKKTKTGFYTGRPKESIFKSPDSVDGKVGVTGSGKPITPSSTFIPVEKTSTTTKRSRP